uniref:Granzyme M n=1 Tax=Latimeria chalumnae TaxID=7897 RepID=H3BGS8_LATCH
YISVKFLTKPAPHKGSVPLQDADQPGSCNITDNDVTTMAPRKVYFRITTENFLLEVQMENKPAWLPACYERWNSSLGNQICRHLGQIRLMQHKGVNLTDIGPNYTQGFAQITHKQTTDIENMWHFRETCTSSKVVALKCYECGIRSKTARIIGGSDAMLGRWPWQVSLYHNSKHMCGGTIITHQWIITAAHCVYKTRIEPNASLPLRAPQMLPHAVTVPRRLARDSPPALQAVILLLMNKLIDNFCHLQPLQNSRLLVTVNDTDTDIIRPVCLPGINQEFPGGTQCWISGWGYTRPDNFHIPDTLKEASVPLISTKKCNSSCMYDGEITPRMLCAGYPEGKTDACQGDSGGPLVCEDGNVWHLVGVVSWGTGCAEPNHPGVYTKVVELLHWIYEIIEVK